jgi:hypothetical protein
MAQPDELQPSAIGELTSPGLLVTYLTTFPQVVDLTGILEDSPPVDTSVRDHVALEREAEEIRSSGEGLVDSTLQLRDVRRL